MLMLLFYIGKERYACDCEHIIEVLPNVKLNPIPQAPPHVAGLLNLGGYPVPVVDLCCLLENRPAEDLMHTRIIMMSDLLEDGEVVQFGLLAEKVTETRDLDLSLFRKSGVNIDMLSFIRGVMNDDEGMIRLLQVNTLLKSLRGSFTKVFGEEKNQEGALQ